MTTSPVIKAPDPTIAKLREVLALVGRRDLAKAETLARQVQQSRPDHADANNVLGIVLLSQKNPGAAVKYLEYAARKQPQNAIYLNNLGCAYLDLGLIERAHAPLTVGQEPGGFVHAAARRRRRDLARPPEPAASMIAGPLRASPASATSA